jgi:DNA repair photolyase
MARKAVFIPYQAKSVLNKHKHPDHWFWTHYSVYPYIGCQHGCEFCYCRERKYAPYENIDDFPYVIKIKQNAPELLRRALMKNTRDAVAVGDYQPLERKFKLSRQLLEVCLEMDFPIFMLERSPLVLRDLDLIREISRRSYASVLFSIIHTPDSPNAAILDRLEHLAPRPQERFAAMEKLSAAGILTGICLMPILPGLSDSRENLELVIQRTADAGGRFVLAAPLTLADQQKIYFFNYMQTNLPDLYPLYQRLYPQGSYGPSGEQWLKVGRMVREICAKVGIADRMPRPILPGEKRALNKRVAEKLADRTYTMELDGEESVRIWPYRKAAWAVEELEQNIGLVYQQLGLKGLQSIQHVGPSIAKLIERYIIEMKSDKKQEMT